MLTLDNIVLKAGSFTLTANFVLDKGSRTAIIGPSGAGKSTLLNAIAGFLPAASGRISFDGTEMTQTAAGERPLSILFQDHNLFPHLTVVQNIGLGISPSLRLSEQDHQEIENALAQSGLEGLGARKPDALSGGQQSRVALARALLRARPILLLDEPFAALGPALKSEMLALVEKIAEAQNLTVLMVSHDPQDALRLCPQTVLVADGNAQPPQPTAHLLENPPPVLRAYLGDAL
jgi:thiamine transport system ATP-binding protein